MNKGTNNSRPSNYSTWSPLRQSLFRGFLSWPFYCERREMYVAPTQKSRSFWPLLTPPPKALTLGGKLGALAIGLSGLFVMIFAMVVAMIPLPGMEDRWAFRIKVIGGATGFVLLGGVIYWRAKWSQRVNIGPL